MDPTNLNKAIIQEPYHFKTPEDIAHLIAKSCVMTVCESKKGYWHQRLDDTSSYFTTFDTEIGHFKYTVMPFEATVTKDVFQHKLNQCFGHMKKIIIIADDQMIIGKQQNHRDHDHTLTTLLDTATCYNIRLNYEKLQYKKKRSISLERPIPPVDTSQPKAK